MAKDLPTVEEFKKSTYVALGQRSLDKVISRLDELLKLYHDEKDEFHQTYVQSDIFFTADYWLKLASKKDKTVNTGRIKGVEKLHKDVADNLCESFDVTVNVLPRELEMCFGRELTGHGLCVDYMLLTKYEIKKKNKLGQLVDKDGQVLKKGEEDKAVLLDSSNSTVEYLKRSDAALYALHFKNGVAYQWKKSKFGLGWRLMLGETASMKLYTKNFMKGFRGFAMSMSRDIYVSGEHTPDAGSGEAFFHSSYLAGGTVMCAGSIKIEKGIIKGMCPDSGHYKPTLNHVAYFLECLQMHGVNLDKVEVFDFKHQSVGSATDFLKNRSKNFLLLSGRKDFLKNVQDQKKGPENFRLQLKHNAMEAKLIEKKPEKAELLKEFYRALSDFKIEGYKKFW